MGFLDMRAEIGNLAEVFARASDSLVMILTCPECATGYFVEDEQIRAAGRTVRCAACGARWTATPERPLELVPAADDAGLAKTATDETSAETVALTGDDLPRAFRTRAEEEKRNRQAVVMGAVWAGVAIVIATVLGIAIVFRESVVRAWPQTASAYATVGLAVNPTGLVIEQVHAEPSLEEGHAALDVTGVIRNVVGRAVIAPPLRITLLNAQGKRVAGQITSFADPHIPSGATRSFRTSIPDPPFSAANLQVDFAIGARSGSGAMQSAAPATPQASSVALRGPASDAALPAVNATPLPPSFATPATPAPAPVPAAAANTAGPTPPVATNAAR
jgi:predicted Zn finger-like uncharacterized protein